MFIVFVLFNLCVLILQLWDRIRSAIVSNKNTSQNVRSLSKVKKNLHNYKENRWIIWHHQNRRDEAVPREFDIKTHNHNALFTQESKTKLITNSSELNMPIINWHLKKRKLRHICWTYWETTWCANISNHDSKNYWLLLQE